MFDWQCHPEAESWLESLLQEFQEQDPHLAELEKVLQEKTSTRLFDWLDHFTVTAAFLQNLRGMAFN